MPLDETWMIQAQQAIIQKLNEEIAGYRTALQYYTGATVVDNWGQQELTDDGDVARDALGWPHPTAHEFNMRMDQSCGCEVCDAARQQEEEANLHH